MHSILNKNKNVPETIQIDKVAESIYRNICFYEKVIPKLLEVSTVIEKLRRARVLN